jgi:hypothetical protein
MKMNYELPRLVVGLEDTPLIAIDTCGILRASSTPANVGVSDVKTSEIDSVTLLTLLSTTFDLDMLYSV